MKIELTKSELNTAKIAINHLIDVVGIIDISEALGTSAALDIAQLADKLNNMEYCEEHEITYEDMTEEDFEAAIKWYDDEVAKEASMID